MRKNSWTLTIAATLSTAALLTTTGCKKKEAPPAAKPVAAAPAAAAAAPALPELPDVDLAAGDKVGGWLTVQSLDKLFQAVDAVGAKVGGTPPGTRSKDLVLGQLNSGLAGVGISGIEWLDWSAPVHVVFQDDLAADAGPDTGVAVILHTLDKAKAIAAFTQAKRGAEAEGHELMVAAGPKALFVDFVGDKTLVFTLDKGRFEKIKGFVGRLDKVAPPSLVYLGLSAEDLATTRKAELEALLAEFEKGATEEVPAAEDAAAKQAVQRYGKTVRTLVNDLRRLEFLVDADVQSLRFEFRVTAKDGSKLHKQLASGKGRTPREIANLLPGNSYLAFASATDPLAGAESLDESLSMFKDLLKLDQPAYDALLADVKQVTKLQDGNSAAALFPDGPAALGAVAVAGATDGEAAAKLTKRIIGALLVKAIDAQSEKDKEAANADLAAVKTALAEMKLQPLVDKYGPLAAEKGVTIALNTSKDGDVTCDTLDLKFDYAKLEMGADAAPAKAVMGEKSALSVCTTKSKLSFGFGPSALETAKRAAQGKAAGLGDAPVYKASAAKQAGASWLLYLNPGAAMTAFRAVDPSIPTISGDKAVLAGCQNRKVSLGCQFEVPVDLLVEVKQAIDKAAPQAPTPPTEGAAPHAEEAPAHQD
jgi:hypothetical protein